MTATLEAPRKFRPTTGRAQIIPHPRWRRGKTKPFGPNKKQMHLLLWEEVKIIRETRRRMRGHMTITQIADLFGVVPRNVSYICASPVAKKRTWIEFRRYSAPSRR